MVTARAQTQKLPDNPQNWCGCQARGSLSHDGLGLGHQSHLQPQARQPIINRPAPQGGRLSPGATGLGWARPERLEAEGAVQPRWVKAQHPSCSCGAGQLRPWLPTGSWCLCQGWTRKPSAPAPLLGSCMVPAWPPAQRDVPGLPSPRTTLLPPLLPWLLQHRQPLQLTCPAEPPCCL